MNQMKRIFKRSTWATLRNLLQDYPYVIGIAVIKVILLIWLVEITDSSANIDHKYDDLIETLTRIVAMLFLATPLLLLFAWRKIQPEIPWKKQLVGIILVILLLGVYYITIPDEVSLKDYYRYGLYVLAVHFVLVVGRYTKSSDSVDHFWKYSTTLLLQIIMSTIYTGILFIGTVIGIYSVQELFGLSENSKLYVYCFVFFATFLHTVFFVNGVEQRAERQEDGLENLLKLLTQYALLPLVILYMLILYAYGIKILVQWELPEGGVGYLVISLAGAGMLSYLLTYPSHQDSHNKFIHFFARYFFGLFLPLNALLLIGTLRRINDYGITENRYLLLVISLWLWAISLYFCFAKRKDIRLIPLSLLVLCVVITVGPWGMFAVSTKSQMNRLVESLRTHQLLSESNQFKPSSESVSFSESDYQEAASIVGYLAEKRELDKLESVFGKKVDSLPEHKFQEQIIDSLRNYIQANAVTVSYSLYHQFEQRVIHVDGFSKLWHFFYNGSTDNSDLGDGYRLTTSNDDTVVQLYHQDTLLVQWNAAVISQQLRDNYGLSSNKVKPEDFTFDADSGSVRAQIRLHSWSLSEGRIQFTGDLLLKE